MATNVVVLTEVLNGVAKLTINRTEKLNALNAEVRHASSRASRLWKAATMCAWPSSPAAGRNRL